MRCAILLTLLSTAVIWPAAAQTPTAPSWDSSGNNLLNGTYYFRQVYYLPSSYGDGSLADAYCAYGSINFDGKGNYGMTVTYFDAYGSGQQGATKGTYTIAASGYGFLQNPITGDYIFGLVSQQGIFVGGDSENQNGYNDIFLAVPIGSTPAGMSTFKGSYTAAFLDLSGDTQSPLYALNATLQMNPDGAGNLGTVSMSGYVGGYGSQKLTGSVSGLKYVFSNGAGVTTFPNSNSSFLAGQYYLYISPDGNFFVGGSPSSFDIMIGVRTGAGTPSLSGLYYQAGVDQDTSQLLTAGYALLDSYYGAFKAGGGSLVGHQRLLDILTNSSAIDYTYSDSYTLAANGAYSTPSMSYVVGANGIRIGTGIGPYLGINVALPAPTFNGTGVYIDPTGVVNAASSAPFTAGVAPGELLTLYGTNLASALTIAPAIPFPTTLDNVQVTVNGIAAPIYYVSPTQLSFIVPYGALTGAIAAIQVNNNGTASNTVTMFAATTAPGIFTVPPGGLGYGAILHQDGTLVTSKSPAQIGETVSVFVTGLGAVSPTIADGDAGPSPGLSYTTNTIAADIGGTTATVTYAGLAPGLAGLYQVNVTIPSGLTSGDNTLDLGGPDSYTSEVLIPIGTGSSSSGSTLPARVHAKAARTPGTKPKPRTVR